MTKKRIATLATCIALVGAVAVGGTLALLSAQSNPVKNTFAVGEGYTGQVVTLDEAQVSQLTNGNYIEASGRTVSNNYNKLVNGTTVHKDPTVTVKANTVDSWVVAYIDNVDDIFSTSKFQDDNTTWYQVTKGKDNNWKVADKAVAGTPITKGYYIYKDVVKKNAKEQKLPDLFETLKVSFTVAPEAVTGLNVKAGVVQYTAGTTDATQLDQAGINAVMSTVETALTQMS